MDQKPKDAVLVFLQSVTPRIGPLNAVNMAKDAHIGAFIELFKSLGVSQEKITEVIDRHLNEMAQKVLSTPTPSPFQRVS